MCPSEAAPVNDAFDHTIVDDGSGLAGGAARGFVSRDVFEVFGNVGFEEIISYDRDI